MSTKTERKRRRQERRRQELSAGQRAARTLRGYFSPRRVVLLGIAAAAIAGAVFLVQVLGGGAEPGKIIEAVRNERTRGLGVSAAVGQLAPNFEGQDLDGNLVRLSDFQGQPVILNFWATWCESCVAEIPSLERVFHEREGEGLVVLGVDWGEGRVGAARAFLDRLGATYVSVMDPTGDIGDSYRVRGLPVTLAIDKDGVIKELVGGELTYRAFDRFAQLALGQVEEVGDDIGPVGDITTRDDSEG